MKNKKLMNPPTTKCCDEAQKCVIRMEDVQGVA